MIARPASDYRQRQKDDATSFRLPAVKFDPASISVSRTAVSTRCRPLLLVRHASARKTSSYRLRPAMEGSEGEIVGFGWKQVAQHDNVASIDDEDRGGPAHVPFEVTDVNFWHRNVRSPVLFQRRKATLASGRLCVGGGGDWV